MAEEDMPGLAIDLLGSRTAGGAQGFVALAAAWGSSILNIKPILMFSHDGMGLLEKARTKGKAVQRLFEIMEERTGDSPVHVNVMHSSTIAEAEALRERIECRFNCVELYVTDFAPTMGVQAGPGVVALAFYREEANHVE